MQTKALTKMALLVAILCVSAYISIPIPISPVPLVLTNLVLALVAFLYGPKETFFIIGTYIFLGAVGLPVFTNGGAGWAHMMGPTGGYLLGFLIGYPLLAVLKGKSYDMAQYILVGLLVAIPISYGCGMTWLKYSLHISWDKAFLLGVAPYVMLDIVKVIIAAWLAKRIPA